MEQDDIVGSGHGDESTADSRYCNSDSNVLGNTRSEDWNNLALLCSMKSSKDLRI